MSAPRLMYGIGNSASTTLSSGIIDSDTAAPLTATTNFDDAPTPGEGMVLFDEGESTEELAYSTGLSGSSLTIPLANRGLEGTSAAGHANSSSVRGPITVGMWNNLITSLLNAFVQSTGAVDTTKIVTLTASQTLTNKSLTTPTITKPVMNATNPSAQTYTPSGGGTATLDLSLANEHRITMPAGNITIALSNDTNAQKFIVSITQDSIGSRTVTWFSTIKWAGGSAPTLTTTANKRDTFGFIRTGSGTYDGFVIGQNL